MGRGGKSGYERVEGDDSTKARCREQEAASSSARRVECSLNADNLGGTGAGEA